MFLLDGSDGLLIITVDVAVSIVRRVILTALTGLLALPLQLLSMVLFNSLFDVLLGSLASKLYVLICLSELMVVWVLGALGGVEGQGQHFEGVLAKALIVLAHVDEHSLLVG